MPKVSFYIKIWELIISKFTTFYCYFAKSLFGVLIYINTYFILVNNATTKLFCCEYNTKP